MRLRRQVTRHGLDVIMASLITAVYTISEVVGENAIASVGELLLELPAVLLAAKLNVFAIPLVATDVFSFPLWVWYCISLLWLSQAIQYLQTDTLTLCRKAANIIKRWSKRRDKSDDCSVIES